MNKKTNLITFKLSLVVCCSTLLVACGFSDNIPVGLEIEREISSDSTIFPPCDARTVKITESAKQNFLVNPNNFRMGRSGQPLEPWVKTPIPDRLLYDGDTLKSRSADIGTYCGGWFTSTIDDYNKIFWETAQTEGSFYTFTESQESMILIDPEKNILFYMHHD